MSEQASPARAELQSQLRHAIDTAGTLWTSMFEAHCNADQAAYAKAEEAWLTAARQYARACHAFNASLKPKDLH